MVSLPATSFSHGNRPPGKKKSRWNMEMILPDFILFRTSYIMTLIYRLSTRLHISLVCRICFHCLHSHHSRKLGTSLRRCHSTSYEMQLHMDHWLWAGGRYHHLKQPTTLTICAWPAVRILLSFSRYTRYLGVLDLHWPGSFPSNCIRRAP